MKVLHKKNQEKSVRMEGIYVGEIGHNKVRKNEIFRIASE